MTDTPAEIKLRYTSRLLGLTPAERLAMATRMFATAKALARAGILLEGGGSGATSREMLFLRIYRGEFGPAETQRIVEHLRAA